jgi:exopolyphosphatase / guanosine-5'-triphosphate,3'-diphosphate pyrophosphatase
MRLGVLDVGSNTVHLLIVDAHRGAEPSPQFSNKTVLRLAELVNKRGDLTRSSAKLLIELVRQAKREATELGCDELLAFATSAMREAGNGAEVLDELRAETKVDLIVLSGRDEARLTFLAVRRWFGWSAGRLLCLDIGGGSLEVGVGTDEDPAISLSLPLGAGRLTRERLDGDPPSKASIAALREYVDEELAEPAQRLLGAGPVDLACGTSKTFRTLARIAGAAPSGEGSRVRRVLSRDGLRQVTAFISRMASADLAELDGVSPARAHQTLAGAVVAAGAMDALGRFELVICPWALREGVILRRLDWLADQ